MVCSLNHPEIQLPCLGAMLSWLLIMPAYLLVVNSVASVLLFLECVVPRFTKKHSSVMNSPVVCSDL